MAIHNIDIHIYELLVVTHNNMMVTHLIKERILRYSEIELAFPKNFLDIH